jgi:DnaK suppressor protein
VVEEESVEQGWAMQPEKLNYFRKLLLERLGPHREHILTEQAAALEASDDGVKDSNDLSLMDVTKEIAFRLGDAESQMVADIDQALLRIKEGTYGLCARCGQPIDERRLEVVPTARYDITCQRIIEQASGNDTPSL